MKANLINAYFKMQLKYIKKLFLTFKIIKAQKAQNIWEEEYMKIYLFPQGEDEVAFYCTPKLRKQSGRHLT